MLIIKLMYITLTSDFAHHVQSSHNAESETEDTVSFPNFEYEIHPLLCIQSTVNYNLL